MNIAQKLLGRRDLDMTTGSITRCLVQFALPLLLGNLFQQLYNMVDTWVIGRFGQTGEYAAVGSVGPIVNILIGLFAGLSSGASVIISRGYGAGDRKKVEKAVHCSMALTFLLSVVFTAVGMATTPLMLRLMLDSSESAGVFPFAQTYLLVYFAGVTGLLIYNMGAGILRAVGDSVRPFLYLLASAVTNIVLDLVFVALLGWGVFGVAFATVIAQAVSAVLVMITLLRSEGWTKMEWKKVRFDRETLSEILRLGTPAALQMAITAFSNVFVQAYIGGVRIDGITDPVRSETVSLAGWTTYGKVDQFIFLPIQSLGLAATTFVGQNLGAGNLSRARRGTGIAWLLATACTVCIGLPVICFASGISSVFNPDPDVVAVASLLLRRLTAFYLFCCINQVLACALRGAGKTTVPMVIMLGAFVGFRQLYLWLMTTHISNDLLPVALGYPAGWAMCAVCMLIYFFCSELSPFRREKKQPA